MAVSYVGAGTDATFSSGGNLAAGGGDTQTVSLPGGVQDGDFLLLVASGYASGAGTMTMTVGSGSWTIDNQFKGNDFVASSDSPYACYGYKIAASEGASYSVTCIRSGTAVYTVHARFLVYRGLNANMSIDSNGEQQSAVGSVAARTITTGTATNPNGTAAQGLVTLQVGAQATFAAIPTWNTPSGTTLDYNAYVDTSGPNVFIRSYHESWASSAAFPTHDYTITADVGTTPDDMSHAVVRFYQLEFIPPNDNWSF
jgi:hypothetical protein